MLQKLYEELRTSFSREDEIDLLSVQKLDYMMAVLHEVLRIYPPVPSAIPRKVPPNGTTIRGEYIPANVTNPTWQVVGVQLLTLQWLDYSPNLAVANVSQLEALQRPRVLDP